MAASHNAKPVRMKRWPMNVSLLISQCGGSSQQTLADLQRTQHLQGLCAPPGMPTCVAFSSMDTIT